MNNTSIKNLEKNGYIYRNFSLELNGAVSNAVNSWKNFCSLPEEKKLAFGYERGEGMGVGYEMKKMTGHKTDLKEDFHFTLGKREWLSHQSSTANSPLCAQDLLSYSNTVVGLLAPFVLEIAQEIEREYGLRDFAKEVAESQDMWFVRYLHYFGDRKIGEEIATSHADKSCFTQHLYEDAPGLQRLSFKNNWEDVEVNSGSSFVIPGMRLQYRSKNKLKALFHRVVANDITNENGRYSMVCFVHLNRTPQYDKNRAGRLQEFPPGFNYKLDFAEFSKLFK